MVSSHFAVLFFAAELSPQSLVITHPSEHHCDHLVRNNAVDLLDDHLNRTHPVDPQCDHLVKAHLPDPHCDHLVRAHPFEPHCDHLLILLIIFVITW